MRYAVFSDVHANLPALEAFVAATCARVDAYVCLGDVVGYGPWNDECLDLVLGLPGIVLLEGRHERLFNGDDPIANELPLTQAFHRASRALFTRSVSIRALPAEAEIGPFLCRHSLPAGPPPARDHFVGRSHDAGLRQGPGARVVDCGSIGLNRRDLSRASFAFYDSGTGEVRLGEAAYSPGRLLREMEARGYPSACVDYYRRRIHGPRRVAG
jgi:hypothetical protein